MNDFIPLKPQDYAVEENKAQCILLVYPLFMIVKRSSSKPLRNHAKIGRFAAVSLSKMTTVRDIATLKLQKRLLEEKLKLADQKIDRFNEVLIKKASLSKPLKETITSQGIPLSEFRIPPNKVKAFPAVQHRDVYALQAEPVLNECILDIHQRHGMRTTGKKEVTRRLKKKEQEELRRKRSEKHIPEIAIPASMLPNRYTRGELPCTIEHGSSGKYLSWACPLENLDYEYYLPLFFDGLQCSDRIISFIARQGIEDLLYAAKGHPERVISVIPLLSRPLRNALAKFDTDILLGVLKALQQLITCNDGIGVALMPFGKQFLAPIAYFMDRNKNTGDEMDYGQRKNNDVGEEIRKVLELMEEHGGPDALKLIKFSIPLYESCLKRPDAHHARDTPAAATGGTGMTGF